MNNVLLKDGSKYSGNYVAIKSFSDRVVINYGKDLHDVYKKAVSCGITDPVVFYVPEKDMVHIY
jgi:CO dehydrogenase/acetyl-CoA synthase beta subunit